MRVVAVADVLEMQAGEVVPAVRGVITEIYQRNTGTFSKGRNVGQEWSLQNAILESGGCKIKLKLDGREPLPNSMKGREVILSSVAKKKGQGFTGLAVELDTYQGVTNTILKVRDSALIEPVEDQGQDQGGDADPENDGYDAPPPPPQKTQQATQQATPPQQSTQQQVQRPHNYQPPTQTTQQQEPATKTAAPSNAVTWGEVGRNVTRLGNVHFVCRRYVTNVYALDYFMEQRRPLTEADINATTQALFIEFNRKFHMGEIPTAPLQIHPKELVPVQNPQQ